MSSSRSVSKYNFKVQEQSKTCDQNIILFKGRALYILRVVSLVRNSSNGKTVTDVEKKLDVRLRFTANQATLPDHYKEYVTALLEFCHLMCSLIRILRFTI